jgi:hypothetical protein
LVGQDLPVVMLRPRVKPEHAPYRVAGDRIRIGGVSYGLAGEISDPDGWVARRVITLLGEGRAIDEVTARLRAETGTRFAVADFVTALGPGHPDRLPDPVGHPLVAPPSPPRPLPNQEIPAHREEVKGD